MKASVTTAAEAIEELAVPCRYSPGCSGDRRQDWCRYCLIRLHALAIVEAAREAEKHLEAIRHAPYNTHEWALCRKCGGSWPCEHEKQRKAALLALRGEPKAEAT